MATNWDWWACTQQGDFWHSIRETVGGLDGQTTAGAVEGAGVGQGVGLRC